MLALWLSLFLTLSTIAQDKKYAFEKTEFFINSNECINCHIFLKNYVITYQNSARKDLYMDVAARDFGLDYLASKGINTGAFDTVFYQELNKRWGGTFESFAVIHNDGRTDTIYIKEPLLFRSQQPQQGTESEEPSPCFNFSNRASVAARGSQFGVADENLKSGTFFIANSGTLICVPDPLGVRRSEHSEKFSDFFARAGINMDLTVAMHPLMRQMDLADERLNAFAFNEQNELRGLVKHPYAYRTNSGDTALAKIVCVHDNTGNITGCFDWSPELTEPPYSDGFAPCFFFGVAFYGGAVYVPIDKGAGNLKANDPVLAKYTPDGKGRLTFVEYADFVLQKDHDNTNIAVGFSNRFTFLKRIGTIYDVMQGELISLNLNLMPDDNFWVHSINELDESKLALLYEEGGVVKVSSYNLSNSNNEVLWEQKKEHGELPILQNEGVFVLKSGADNDDYSFYPIKF